MIKTDRYVQTEAVGMLYRLIPVTEEIIRCVIGKEEIKGLRFCSCDSLKFF